MLYYQVESQSPKNENAKKTYTCLQAQGTKHMLIFLNYILSKVDALNREFQAEGFRLHCVHKSVSTTYRDLLNCFVQEDVMSQVELSDIDPKDDKIHVTLDKVYIGGRGEAHRLKEPVQEPCLTNFKTDCKKVLIELCFQIKQGMNLSKDNLLAKLQVLDQEVAQDLKQSPGSIHDIAMNFIKLIQDTELDELADEWRSYRRGENSAQ